MNEHKEIRPLDKTQAIILTGYTGITCCRFSDFHEDVQKRMGRPVFTHEFASEQFKEKLMELYREDFLLMVSDA